MATTPRRPTMGTTGHQTQEQGQTSHKAAGSPQPAVGSLVHYHGIGADPGPDPGEAPLAAIVASVLTDNALNLMVIAADGSTFARQGVLFCRKGDSTMGLEYCDVPGAEAASSEDDDAYRPRRARASELLQQAQAFHDRQEARKKELEAQEEAAEAEKEKARALLGERPAKKEREKEEKAEEEGAESGRRARYAALRQQMHEKEDADQD